MKKILISGASGFLGYKLLPQLQKKYEIEALYFRQNFEISNVNWSRINLLEEKELTQKLSKTKVDAVIHAAAIANPNFCEENAALSHHVNVYSTVAMADYCKKMGIPLIFISSDLVFNGSVGDYTESDFCFPLSKYGEQKLAAEEILLNDYENCLICRLPLLFGFGPTYSANFFTDSLKKFDKNEEIIAFSDEFRSPLSSIWAARGIELALDYLFDNKIDLKEKIIHLGGPESISRYEFALLIADVFGFDTKNVESKLRSDFPMPAARPEDVSLNSSLASDILKFNPSSLKDQLLEIKNSIKYA
jgi:dTDP-4-dehydrorhamnose reductase